jgi:prepilin-type N-terminal cleavage/methylation domain-containing protein
MVQFRYEQKAAMFYIEFYKIIMKLRTKRKGKGFTLIELLIVIAIIAILSIVVVLTLNPAEMLRRSRDSNRVSDLGIIKTSISLYFADVSTTNMGTAATCYIGYTGTTAPGTMQEFASGAVEATASLTGNTYATSTGAACPWFTSATLSSASAARTVAGSGWIPVNLSAISSGAPIGQWPVDPSYSAGTACTTAPCNGSAAHFYSYVSTSTNSGYKVAAKMESALYSASGTSDLESTDGGTDADQYEQGSNLTL